MGRNQLGVGGTKQGQKTALGWRSLGWEGPPARGEGDPRGTEEPPGGRGGPAPPPLSRPVARGAASGPELQRKGMPGLAGAAAPRAGLVRAALGAAGAAARARAGSGRASQRGCAPPLPHNSKACQAGSRLLAPGSAPGKKKGGGTRKRKKQARERARPAARNRRPTRTAARPSRGQGVRHSSISARPHQSFSDLRRGRLLCSPPLGASSLRASWVGRRPHARGPDVRKLLRGRLQQHRGGSCARGRGGCGPPSSTAEGTG